MELDIMRLTAQKLASSSCDARRSRGNESNPHVCSTTQHCAFYVEQCFVDSIHQKICARQNFLTNFGQFKGVRASVKKRAPEPRKLSKRSISRTDSVARDLAKSNLMSDVAAIFCNARKPTANQFTLRVAPGQDGQLQVSASAIVGKIGHTHAHAHAHGRHAPTTSILCWRGRRCIATWESQCMQRRIPRCRQATIVCSPPM